MLSEAIEDSKSFGWDVSKSSHDWQLLVGDNFFFKKKGGREKKGRKCTKKEL